MGAGRDYGSLPERINRNRLYLRFLNYVEK